MAIIYATSSRGLSFLATAVLFLLSFNSHHAEAKDKEAARDLSSQTPLSLICDIAASVAIGEEMELNCEIGNHMHIIENHSSEFDTLFESGRLRPSMRLDIQGAFLSNGRFVIPSDAEIAFETSIDRAGRHRGRQLARGTSGDKTFLVVYVRDTNGGKPGKDPSGGVNTIENDVFGTYGFDDLNLANVYESCSNGALDFKPYTGTLNGNEITNGVHEITIARTVSGADRGDVASDALIMAENQLGSNLSNNVDYVMFCLPPGSTNQGKTGWLAYAYLNHWRSVYNDNWCSSISTLAHETGHNLNLGHSGEIVNAGLSAYADEIGYMGFGYNQDDTPVKCFNAPKTHQLGWFTSHHADRTIADFSYEGRLYGFADVQKIASDDKMIVKLIGNTGTSSDYGDFYVSFNRATGNNEETKESRNKVVIHSCNTSYWGPKSIKLAELSANGIMTVMVKGIEVTIQVTAIDIPSGSAAGYATVSIFAGPSNAPSLSNYPSLSSSPSETPSISLEPSMSIAPTVGLFALATEYLFGDYYAASKSGVMFDVTATEEIQITKLAVRFFFNYGAGVEGIDTDIEIYVKTGSYIGSANNIGDWDLHMARTTIVPTNVESGEFLTTIELPTPIGIGDSETVSIYITNRDANNYLSLAYRDTAADHDDVTVTVAKGKFAKFAYFDGTSADDLYGWGVNFAFTGIISYNKTGNYPSSQPSVTRSDSPSLSLVPSLSMVPSETPSLSVIPSLLPSDEPSSKPSVSIEPTSLPSDKPSSSPSISINPSSEPTTAPSKRPTTAPINPTSSPSKPPTKMPSFRPSTTQDPSGIRPSSIPSLSLTPSNTVSEIPSLFPSVSLSPSYSSMAPSIKRFKVITTSCYVRYPFRGISSSQLDARFAAIAALFLKAITAQVPKDQWGVRIVSIGDRDVRRVRLLSNVSRALDEEGEIEVEVELISETICAGDECSESELSAAYQGGEEVLVGVTETADSGVLIEAILVEAVATGLDDVFADVVVGEIETDLPQTDVVQSTLSPSVSPSSLSQTCEDSPLKFKLTTAVKSTYKKCEWVGRLEDRKAQRCAIEGVSTHCPSTCGTCATCNDSTMRWNLPIEMNIMSRRHCKWTARKNTATRCSIPGVSETCRSTCKFGDDCCIDDTDFTFPMIKDPTKEQTCAWILKNNVETRRSNYCGDAVIAASCPESCGTCGCVNNPYFTFPMIKDPTKEQTCAWILKDNVET